MSNYQAALAAYLKDGNSESDLAQAAGCKQATINRYRHGKRFPDAEQARKIADATKGAVPFDLWQNEFLARSGIAA